MVSQLSTAFRRWIVHGSNVRIGLDAPSHVQILRNELLQNREEFDKVLFDVDSEAESENWDGE